MEPIVYYLRDLDSELVEAWQRHFEHIPEVQPSAEVACPGLATATGEMPAEICARQMYAAYAQIVLGQTWHPANISEVLLEHYRLLRAAD